MRVLLVDFAESIHMVRATVAALEPVRADIVGWVVRPHRVDQVRAACDCPGYPMQFDGPTVISHRVSLSDTYFSSEEEETLLYLLDREQSYANSLQLTQRRLEALAWATDILERCRPTHILFSDVPHNVFSYLIYLLGLRAGSRTYFVRWGPAPHLFSYGSAVERGLTETWEDGRVRANGAQASQLSADYIERLRRDYRATEPEYMRRQRSKSSTRGRITSMMRRPSEIPTGEAFRKVRAHLQRDALRKAYEREATASPDLSSPFVALFLHLQPERSSSPEGGRYAQQLRIVETLANVIPSDWRVFVREHPSTFMSGPKLVRGRWSYSALARMPTTELVSIEVDPFDLVDHSRLVATITGTVGFEAVARGKPVAVFGSAPYVGCDGVHSVRDRTDAKRAIDSIRRKPSVPVDAPIRLLAEFEASPRTFVASSDALSDPVQFWRSGVVHGEVLHRVLHHEGLLQ